MEEIQKNALGKTAVTAEEYQGKQRRDRLIGRPGGRNAGMVFTSSCSGDHFVGGSVLYQFTGLAPKETSRTSDRIKMTIELQITLLFLAVFGVLPLYLLPSAIAYSRSHKNFKTILLLNLFLGITNRVVLDHRINLVVRRPQED